MIKKYNKKAIIANNKKLIVTNNKKSIIINNKNKQNICKVGYWTVKIIKRTRDISIISQISNKNPIRDYWTVVKTLNFGPQ